MFALSFSIVTGGLSHCQLEVGSSGRCFFCPPCVHSFQWVTIPLVEEMYCSSLCNFKIVKIRHVLVSAYSGSFHSSIMGISITLPLHICHVKKRVLTCLLSNGNKATYIKS